MQFNWVEIIGYIGAGFALATFAMKTIIPLRLFGIASNLTFLAYGYAHAIYPTIVVNAILLPMNIWRLREMLQLTRKVERAAKGDLTVEWLKPFMTSRTTEAGEIIFRRGDAAECMFYTVKGSFRLREIGIELGPGQIVGELGLLAPENKRTQTLEVLSAGEILSIRYSSVRELYHQNPKFGFFFLRLAAGRLFDNLARLEGEIERLRASHPGSEPLRQF